MIRTISPAFLAELHQSGRQFELIDVRTPAEYREAHVEFARNVPLDQLGPQALKAQRHQSSGPLYVICRSGSRGEQACRKLAEAGVSDVSNVEGGTVAWIAAGLPIVQGKKTISLERQVRITAGSLVLLGTALGFMVHPYWIGLAAFVGAGLVFSGVSDTCGMGLLLARMPWNQVQVNSGATNQTGSCCGDSRPPGSEGS